MIFGTNNTERARITSGGDLCVNTTSAISDCRVTIVDSGNSHQLALSGSNQTGIQLRNSTGGDGWIIGRSIFGANANDFFIFDHASAATRFFIDTSGNVGIGTTSPGAMLDVAGNARSNAWIGRANGSAPTADAAIYRPADNTLGFSTNNTERARITSGGYLKVQADTSYQSAAGSYNEISNSAANEYSLWIRQTNVTTPFGTYIQYPNGSPNGTGNNFILCIDSTATRATIRSNGGLANYQANNVDLSDARTKKDIIPAASMWGKVSALEIVTYKYNDQTHDDVNLGVIAQQVESVEPVWVENDGFGETPEGEEPLKTVYTKDIYFAAIKALQEAMARIEQLEAKFAALESK
jgi:hypothetical protein